MYFLNGLTDDITYIGVNDRNLERFDNYIPTPFGMSYNSYFIDSDKTCAIDGVELAESEPFLEMLSEKLHGRDLDYIVVNHAEPDHSSGVAQLVKLYPNIKIVGNAKTFTMLENLWPDFPQENKYIIKDGDILDLGKHKLTFALMPMVHWPESMATYDITEKVLFPNDAFGSFGCLDGGIYVDEYDFDLYKSEMRRYYANVVGKYGVQVAGVLKKLSTLEIRMVAPSHGLIWREDIPKLISLYSKWANCEPEEQGVVIVYGSMYGNTARMAQILGRSLNCAGITNVKIYDASRINPTYIISDIWKYGAVMMGSCAYNSGVHPVIDPILYKLKLYGLKNKDFGIFGTMMWSGGGVRAIKTFAESLKNIAVVGVVEAKGAPREADIEQLNKMAQDMAQKVLAYKI